MNLKKCFGILLHVFVALTVTSSVAAKSYSLRLRVDGWSQGYVCDSSLSSRVAGGREKITLLVTPWHIERYPELELGTPLEVSIVAGSINSFAKGNDSERFVANSELTEDLAIERIRSWFAAGLDSFAQAEGSTPLCVLEKRLTFRFVINIPEKYVGTRVFLKATFESPETGELSYITAFDVISPCNARGLDVARGSWVREANYKGNHVRAVEIADSLFEIGWRDAVGLGWATRSAAELGRWETVLRFMDRNYEVNGQFTATGGDNAESYDEKRQEVLQRINDH